MQETLNGLGCRLVERARHDEGIAVFRLNAELLPRSAKATAWPRASSEAGRSELGEVHYREPLELDPDNSNALSKLREMRSGP